MPAERRTRSTGPDDARADGELDPAVELLGVARAGLGEDDGELVAADAAGDVGLADGAAEALGHGGEDGVAGQVAQAVVRALEVVDVEDDEGQAALVPVCAGAFAQERLVEVAPVVDAGEGVDVRLQPRLPELLGVPDRGRARSRQSLELGDLLVRGHPVLAAPEDGQGADRADVILAQGDRDAASDQPARRPPGRVVAVADADCARPARRRARHRLARRLLRAHPERRDDRRLLGLADDRHGGVDPVGGRRGGEGALENRVEVDRRGNLRERLRAGRLPARVLERRLELVRAPAPRREPEAEAPPPSGLAGARARAGRARPRGRAPPRRRRTRRRSTLRCPREEASAGCESTIRGPEARDNPWRRPGPNC